MSRRTQQFFRAVLLMGATLLWLASSAAAQVPVPDLAGRVVDRAGVLPAATEARLTSTLADHEAQTGNQVAVLTLPSLEGEPIERAALRIARAWALGTAASDNGVLLLIAVEDRRMRIEVGDGLTGALPDITAGRIIRHEMRPAFRAGDYADGVTAGVSAILGTIEGTYEPPTDGDGDNGLPLFARLFFAVAFGGIFGLLPPLVFGPTFWLAGQWSGVAFVSIFFVVGVSIAGLMMWPTWWVPPLVGLLFWSLVGMAEWWFRQQDGWQSTRQRVRRVLDENKGEKVELNVGGFWITAGGITSGGGSGGSSFGSGGSGFSGGSSGGFSGGGGSFSGGGASGSW